MTESEVLDVRIGDEHITPEQIMDVNIGTYGPGDYVIPTGKKFEAQLISNNTVRVFDGVMVYNGVRDVIAVNNYHDVAIENGSQGMNRNDIIVRHFSKSEETQFGEAEFQVIKGTPASGDATDPSVSETNLRDGDLTHDMKLYRVRLEGLNVVGLDPLFEELPSIPDLKEDVKSLNGKIEDMSKKQPVEISHVITGNGTNAYYPFTLSDVREYLGDNTIGVQDVVITAMNADYGAARYSVSSLNWHGESVLLFLSGNLPSSQMMRINFAFTRKL